MTYRKTEIPIDAKYLTEHQKAAEFQCSVAFLRKDRMRDKPTIPYIKIGRMVRYLPSEAS